MTIAAAKVPAKVAFLYGVDNVTGLLTVLPFDCPVRKASSWAFPGASNSSWVATLDGQC